MRIIRTPSRGMAMIVALVTTYSILVMTLIAIRFVAERRKAMTELRKVQIELHRAHESGRRGARHWWPVVDHPSQGPHELSRRKKYKKHDEVYADF